MSSTQHHTSRSSSEDNRQPSPDYIVLIDNRESHAESTISLVRELVSYSKHPRSEWDFQSNGPINKMPREWTPSNTLILVGKLMKNKSGLEAALETWKMILEKLKKGYTVIILDSLLSGGPPGTTHARAYPMQGDLLEWMLHAVPNPGRNWKVMDSRLRKVILKTTYKGSRWIGSKEMWADTTRCLLSAPSDQVLSRASHLNSACPGDGQWPVAALVPGHEKWGTLGYIGTEPEDPTTMEFISAMWDASARRLELRRHRSS